MATWSDLYAGDPNRIGSALARGDDPVVEAHAVLPGVVPDPSLEHGNSLDLMTEAASTVVGTDLSFAASLRDPVGLAGHVLADDWVALFGGLDFSSQREIADLWLRDWDPGAEADPARRGAVERILADVAMTCRVARRRGVPVVVYCAF
jgi:hypothetical protein